MQECPHFPHISTKILLCFFSISSLRILLKHSGHHLNNFTVSLIRYMSLCCYLFCCDIGVTRSTKIKFDRDYQNVFKNLRFCGKTKNCTLPLTSIFKRLTLTITRFYFTNSHFKDFNLSSHFFADHHILYSFSFLPRAWILPGLKSCSTNLVRGAGRPISFQSTESLGW